jgi:hypothetical protein
MVNGEITHQSFGLINFIPSGCLIRALIVIGIINLSSYHNDKVMNQVYLSPTQEAGRELFQRNIKGQVVMLNLLRFRAIADYTDTPTLAPPEPISGEAAYQLYIEQTLPHLKKSGGDILFLGKGGLFLIGPADERWDAVMLIRQNSIADFFAFANDEEYLEILGHRTAALEDSRLLPLIEEKLP